MTYLCGALMNWSRVVEGRGVGSGVRSVVRSVVVRVWGPTSVVH